VVRCVLAGAALVSATVVGLPRPLSGAAEPMVQVGHNPELPAGATFEGDLTPTATLRISVVLRSADPSGLANYAQEVATPGSPVYRQFLPRKRSRLASDPLRGPWTPCGPG
jgi:subtilase family serine protease